MRLRSLSFLLLCDMLKNVVTEELYSYTFPATAFAEEKYTLPWKLLNLNSSTKHITSRSMNTNQWLYFAKKARRLRIVYQKKKGKAVKK